MSNSIEGAGISIPEKAEITARRHARSFSVEVTDASSVVTKATADAAMADMMMRLYQDLIHRFGLREIQEIIGAEPQRKMALRVSLQLIDEGANDWEIREAAHYELRAFDMFVERERPKLLVKPEKAVVTQ
jgi:hypothetical protein